MKIDLSKMAEATRLVRHGQLRDATRLIQAALGGHAAEPGAAAPPPATPDDEVIDVSARVVATHEAAGIEAPAPATSAASTAPPASVTPAAPVTPAASAAPPRAATAPSRFVPGSFSDGHGRRDYKLFVPAQAAAGQPLPLVVMLHGCTQNPDDFAAGTGMNDAAATEGCYVLYPAQSRQANPQGCWNWFKHSHQQRERGEPALLAGMTREVMAAHRIDPQRVYVAGLSAGGAMAAILGDTHPDLFAAVGVHSGLAAGSALDLPSALMAMNRGGGGPAGAPASEVPTIVFHGDADATVHLRNGEHVIAACVGSAGTVEVEAVQSAGLRDATRAIYRAADGRIVAERWTVHGAPHAWSGGRAAGSYTDARGPDASAQMLRFFLAHPLPPGQGGQAAPSRQRA